MVKICKFCKIEKGVGDFYKDKTMVLGCWNTCKKCVSIKRKNDPRIKEINRYNRNKNKSDYNKYSREYRKRNKEYLKEYNRKYRNRNKEKMKEYKKEYYIENIDKIKEYVKINEDRIRDTRRRYKKLRYQTDELYRFTITMRKNLRSYIVNCGYKKKSKTREIIGCSFEELKNYIESKFESWMNWGNYGIYNGEINYGWDIDHIIPLSSAKNEEEVIKLNHYTNLQPLCSYTNRYLKKNKIIVT